jgi:hypothetical protein
LKTLTALTILLGVISAASNAKEDLVGWDLSESVARLVRSRSFTIKI